MLIVAISHHFIHLEFQSCMYIAIPANNCASCFQAAEETFSSLTLGRRTATTLSVTWPDGYTKCYSFTVFHSTQDGSINVTQTAYSDTVPSSEYWDKTWPFTSAYCMNIMSNNPLTCSSSVPVSARLLLHHQYCSSLWAAQRGHHRLAADQLSGQHHPPPAHS